MIPKLATRADARASNGRLAGATRRRRPAGVIPEAQTIDAVLRRDTVFRRLLGVSDILAATFAAVLVVAVIGGDGLRPAAFLAIPAVTLVCKAIGLYDRDQHVMHKTTIDEMPALLQVATLYALLAWLGEGVAVDGTLGKPQVVAIWLLVFVSMTVARAVARRIARTVTTTERCLVIGDAGAAEWIREKFAGAPGVKAEVVGRVPLGPERDDGRDIPVLAALDTLGLALVDHDVHRAVIAPGETTSADVLDVIRTVKALGVRVSVLPRLFEVIGSSVEVDDIHGAILLGVRPFGLTLSSRLLKRAIDVVAAATALLLLAPLVALIALLIKLDSPGPVLFRQRRIGLAGREFVMLKFRTMVADADAQKHELTELNEAVGLFKIADDPRITRVGHYLRQMSLDELPQLWNVLRGQMSLVGPRPLIPAEDRRVEGWRRRRLHIPPGMTGLWQIFGSARIPLDEMLKIDYLYGANWSPWLDLKILMRTVPFALGRRGL